MSCINPNVDFGRMPEIKYGSADHKPIQAEQERPTICRDVFTPDATPKPEFSRQDMWKWMGTGGL